MGSPSKCWNKRFHVKKGANCCGFQTCYISHQVLNSRMKSFSLMVLVALENQWGPLEAPYMSHMNGIDIISGNSTSKSREISSNANVGGMGG